MDACHHMGWSAVMQYRLNERRFWKTENTHLVNVDMHIPGGRLLLTSSQYHFGKEGLV